MSRLLCFIARLLSYSHHQRVPALLAPEQPLENIASALPTMSQSHIPTPSAPRFRMLSLPPVEDDVHDNDLLAMAAAASPPEQKDLLWTPPPPTVLQLAFDMATMCLASLEPINLERLPSKKTHTSRSSRSGSNRQSLQSFNKSHAGDRPPQNT